MVGLAIMAWLTVLICYGGNWVLGQCMIERPLVVGLVAGLLMGDVKTGAIIGASLEAIFMARLTLVALSPPSLLPRPPSPSPSPLALVSTRVPPSHWPFPWASSPHFSRSS